MKRKTIGIIAIGVSIVVFYLSMYALLLVLPEFK